MNYKRFLYSVCFSIPNEYLVLRAIAWGRPYSFKILKYTTAQKFSILGIFLIRIFPYSVLIRRNADNKKVHIRTHSLHNTNKPVKIGFAWRKTNRNTFAFIFLSLSLSFSLSRKGLCFRVVLIRMSLFVNTQTQVFSK